MEKANYKKLTICFIAVFAGLLLIPAALMIIIDPYFHYHKPLKNVSYYMDEERYFNDGIIKHFEYDALVTGSSLIENSKKSDVDALFNVNCIKVPFSGGSYREINENISKALEYNPECKTIFRGLDFNRLAQYSDEMYYDSYPTYLYDESVLNDGEYIFNKSIYLRYLLKDIKLTLNGEEGTDFDEYKNWNDMYSYGKEAILANYYRRERIEDKVDISEYDKSVVIDNIDTNVVDIISNNPEVTFYLYIPPYSIYYFDDMIRSGTLERQFDVEKIAMKEILDYPNVRVYDFSGNYEIVCNSDLYKDLYHYNEDVNTMMFTEMSLADSEYLLTAENYEEKIENNKEYYVNYDYDVLFE